MVATSAVFTQSNPDVRVLWDCRPLQAFADQPVENMAKTYDLMVIDHPHVGDAARDGLLLDFASCAHAGRVAAIGSKAVGRSHESYAMDGGQWALAIDTATPVACWRPDLIDAAPATWSEVVALASAGKVIWPLKPVDSLMSFITLSRNLGMDVGEDGRFIGVSDGLNVLAMMRQLVELVPSRCLAINPIETYEWLIGDDGYAYCPLGYGYSNYARPGFRDKLLRFADMPVAGDSGPIGSCLGGAGLAISAACAYPDIALRYALWVADAECQRGLYFDAGGQPGHADAWDDARCNEAASCFFKDTRATHEGAWVRPRHSGYLPFQDQGGTLVHAHLRGDVGAALAVERLNALYEQSFG